MSRSTVEKAIDDVDDDSAYRQICLPLLIHHTALRRKYPIVLVLSAARVFKRPAFPA